MGAIVGLNKAIMNYLIIYIIFNIIAFFIITLFVQLYVRLGILLTCRKQFHDLIISLRRRWE